MKLNDQIYFTPSKVRVTEQQVAEFEKMVGFHLPHDYREFVKAYNGPKAEPADPMLESLFQKRDVYLAVDLRGESDIPNLEWFDISWWMGFADPAADYKYGMVEQNEVFQNDWGLPAGIIAIAGSVGPGRVFLNLAEGPRKHHVLLVGDRIIDRQADGLDIKVDDFVSVASSFTEFVKKLSWQKLED
jgi:SMI1 / KNR4 family (SUKH-1)